MYTVLVIEDNTDMREVLARFLHANGFLVTSLDSTEDGIDAVDEHEFDIALIDINLPGKSGFSMIEYIHEQGKTMPLIAMTARDGVQDKLAGFELGLTDYVVKPFDLDELLARMTSHLRNAGIRQHKEEVNTATYRLNPETWEFLVSNKPVSLTKTEFRMMHILLLQSPSIVKINDMIHFVWGEEPAIVNPPVRIHLANLRKKIRDKDCSIIKTIPSIGYKLNDPQRALT